MEKQIIREEIFTKQYDGIIRGVIASDLPSDILPTDIIDLEKVDREYTENNSWDDHTILTVYREREETDDEFEKRKSRFDKIKEESKKLRLEQYQKLKIEFQNTVIYTEQDMIDCFTAGVKFGRDMMNNPSNTEYMMIVNDNKKL